MDGFPHSITVDWMQGVTCPFVRGECVLPGFKLPEKPGVWEGKVYFSADRSLSVTVSVSYRNTCLSLADDENGSVVAVHAPAEYLRR